MASILDNEKDIEKEAALRLVTKTIDEVIDIYESADLKAGIKLAGLTSILYEHREDEEFPKTNELPSTYTDLKRTKDRSKKDIEYLRAERASLQNQVGELRGSIIALNGKIRALETMLGWFVHEHSKLNPNPDHAKGLDAVMTVHGIEDQSMEKIHNYAKQFKEL